MLPGNLGYVKFDGFMSVDGCGPTAAGAMELSPSNADALIFDLRENHGGDPAMVAFICSYLFAAPTHLNDLFDRVDNTTRQSWMQAYVPGKRFPTVPVFVLTSSQTFSGAESLRTTFRPRSVPLSSARLPVVVHTSSGRNASTTASSCACLSRAPSIR